MEVSIKSLSLPLLSSCLIKVCYRDPADNTKTKDTLDYYLWLAKLADKGKITSIFFADGYGLHQTYQGKPDATYAGGSMVAYMDPVVMVSAMAAVTKSVAFGITGSTSYIRELYLHSRLRTEF